MWSLPVALVPYPVKYAYCSVSTTLVFAEHLWWLREITTDPHILTHTYTECPDDRYTKLKIYISEFILDRH